MIVSYHTQPLPQPPIQDDSQMNSQSTSLTENSSGSHPRKIYLNDAMLPHHHSIINLLWNTGKTMDSSYLGGGPLTQTITTIINPNPSQLTVEYSPLSPIGKKDPIFRSFWPLRVIVIGNERVWSLSIPSNHPTLLCPSKAQRQD